MKVYISIPIIGCNVKIFRSWISVAKETLSNNGYTPISPLDLVPEEDRPYSYYMGKDILMTNKFKIKDK